MKNNFWTPYKYSVHLTILFQKVLSKLAYYLFVSDMSQLPWANALGRPPLVKGPIGEVPSEEHAQTIMVNNKVIEQTLTQYRGRAAQVGRYAYQLRQEVEGTEEQDELLAPLRKGQFFQYLHACLVKKVADGEAFRCALLHLQLSGEPIRLHMDLFMPATDGTWLASDLDVVAAVEGLGYKAGIVPINAQKPRGAITISMAKGLITWVTHKPPQLNRPVSQNPDVRWSPGSRTCSHERR